MWELDYKERWAPKNWCFWTVILEKTLENPLNSKVILPVHPKSPEYSLEELMLKLKLQYFGHLMWRTDSFEKTLMVGRIEGGRSRGWQRMRWLDGITDSMDMSVRASQQSRSGPENVHGGARKETKARDYNKDGVERFRHVSTKGRSLTPTLFSILYLYRRGEKDKTVDIFSWLTYTSYKQSQEILRAWEWHPVIISYTR